MTAHKFIENLLHNHSFVICITIEDEYGNTPAQQAKFDWLLYNKPLEYAQLVLGVRLSVNLLTWL